jgi:hypothetical protein
MRRKRTFKHGRVVSLLIAGCVGYVLVGFNPAPLHKTDLSAAQTVALRFPQDFGDTASMSTLPRAEPNSNVLGAPQTLLALLDPTPMAPQTPTRPAQIVSAVTSVTPIAPAAAQTATKEHPAQPRPTAAMALVSDAKAVAAAVRRHADRAGFILNDAQIASIKQRLHLTPDQEQMWPAVEAALRNLAYARAREMRRSGDGAELASADPNSTDVQDLKSAAIPLLMSFDSEQKDEVRSLAHVMGLDQLANQF